jgi:hypothetical protein
MSPRRSASQNLFFVLVASLVASGVTHASPASPGIVCESSPWIESRAELIHIDLEAGSSDRSATISVLELSQQSHRFSQLARGALDENGQGEIQLFAATPRWFSGMKPFATLSVETRKLSDPVKGVHSQLVGTYKPEGESYLLRCTIKSD